MKSPKENKHQSRRKFLYNSACITGAAILGGILPQDVFGYNLLNSPKVILSGHVWLYASKFPPNWDCTPILEQVFSDFKYAGLAGVEFMESNLRRKDIVSITEDLAQKYGVPVTGTSYNARMWDRSKQQEILDDVELVVDRLQQLNGKTFGITVGDAGRLKTTKELDAQAQVLEKIMTICENYKVQPNLHNHTFEVENDLHDFKGTIERVPKLKLGPDINWLIRGGVDPVWFIDTYGDRMVYLHIRDQKANGEWTKVVGKGVTDFPGIAAALKRANFTGRAAIELAFEEPPEGAVREEWKCSREYVKEVFGW